MPEKRSFSENHGDFEFTVEEGEETVLSYRKPLNGSSDNQESVKYDDLPSQSLKDEYKMLDPKVQWIKS